MDNLIVTALVGVGCFILGWFTNTWITRTRQAAAEAAEPPMSSWKCTSCGRVKTLPAELDSRVKICNNCNVRLVRASSEAV